MIKEVILAKIGLTMETGTILKWLKKEGDYVEQGDQLLEVETDKVTTVVEAFHPGYLKKIIQKEGSEVPVNAVIAYVGEKDDDLDSFLKDRGSRDSVELASSVSTDAKKVENKAKGTARVRVNASPLAKRLAAELGVDLSLVKGTGPDNRIGKEDVQAAAKELVSGGRQEYAAVKDSDVKILSEEKLTGIKKVIAGRMKASYNDAPHIHLELSVDMTNASLLRDRMNKESEKVKHITYTDIIVKTAAEVLKKNRLLNATLREDVVLIFEDINIGIAVSTDKGLVVPVIKNADNLDLAGISLASRNLIDRVRAGKQSIDDVSGGTFTITNLGMFGVESFKPILNPKQSAILAVGVIKETAAAGGSGQVLFRPMMNISLACDHRIIDGAEGAKFLSELKGLLENPSDGL
jgi:pyruvate dehydrogenase E2 component (dihydrolipoamide acetyltransferase)